MLRFHAILSLQILVKSLKTKTIARMSTQNVGRAKREIINAARANAHRAHDPIPAPEIMEVPDSLGYPVRLTGHGWPLIRWKWYPCASPRRM